MMHIRTFDAVNVNVQHSAYSPLLYPFYNYCVIRNPVANCDYFIYKKKEVVRAMPDELS